MGKITLTFNELKGLIKLGFLKPREDGEHKYSRKQITKAHKKKLAYERKTKGEKLYRSRGGGRPSRGSGGGVGGSVGPSNPVFTNSSNLATESQSIANRAAEIKLKQLQDNINGRVEGSEDGTGTRFDIGSVKGLLLKQKEEYEGVLANRLTEADEAFNKRLADADEAFNGRLDDANTDFNTRLQKLKSKTSKLSATLDDGITRYNNDQREWKSFQQKMTGDDYGNLVGNVNTEASMKSMDSTGASENVAQSVTQNPQMDRPTDSTNETKMIRLPIEASPAVVDSSNNDENQSDDDDTVDTQDESNETIGESSDPVDVKSSGSLDVSLVEADHPNVTVRKSKSKPKTISVEATDEVPFVAPKVKKIAKKAPPKEATEESPKEATEESPKEATEEEIKPKRGRPKGNVPYRNILTKEITAFNKEMKSSQVYNRETDAYEPWVSLKSMRKDVPTLEYYVEQIRNMKKKKGYYNIK